MESLKIAHFKASAGNDSDLRIKKSILPFVSIPKGPSSGQKFTLTFEDSPSTSSKQYSNVARPRNQFIVARMILNKIVLANCNDTIANDDVSKIISIIWKTSSSPFQKYFKYLSLLEESWHEEHYPLYHYQPKVRSKTIKSLAPVLEQSRTMTGRISKCAPLSSLKKKSGFVNTSPHMMGTYVKLSTSSFRHSTVVSNVSINLVSKFRLTKGHTSGTTYKKRGPRSSKDDAYIKNNLWCLSGFDKTNYFEPLFYEDKIQNITLEDFKDYI